jgi:lantibiotic modifying enzyme
MKKLFLLCSIAVLALVSLSCAPEARLEISANEVDNGIIVENLGSVACIVYVKSLDAEQEFELAVGESRLIIDLAKPIEVSAVSSKDKQKGAS